MCADVTLGEHRRSENNGSLFRTGNTKTVKERLHMTQYGHGLIQLSEENKGSRSPDTVKYKCLAVNLPCYLYRLQHEGNYSDIDG